MSTGPEQTIQEQFVDYVESHIPYGEDKADEEIVGLEPWHSITFEKIDDGEVGFAHYITVNANVAGFVLDAFGVSLNPNGSFEVEGASGVDEIHFLDQMVDEEVRQRTQENISGFLGFIDSLPRS